MRKPIETVHGDARIERDIRRAYAQCIRNGADHGQEPGDWVAIGRLLDYIDYPKTQLDRVIIAMSRRRPGGACLVSEDNQKVLAPADRAAAVRMGHQDKHLISIKD